MEILIGGFHCIIFRIIRCSTKMGMSFFMAIVVIYFHKYMDLK